MTAGSAAPRLRVDHTGDARKVAPDVLRFAALTEDKRALLLHVSDLLDEIAFGTVVIVVQDGTVIQIETSEKIRLR